MLKYQLEHKVRIRYGHLKTDRGKLILHKKRRHEGKQKAGVKSYLEVKTLEQLTDSPRSHSAL